MISCLIKKKDKKHLHIIQEVAQFLGFFYMLFLKTIYTSSLFISMLKYILKKIDLWSTAQNLKLNRKKYLFSSYMKEKLHIQMPMNETSIYDH